jgi:hypothetical protein
MRFLLASVVLAAALALHSFAHASEDVPPPQQHTITVTPSVGSILPFGRGTYVIGQGMVGRVTVAHGADQEFSIEAADGYTIRQIMVDGKSLTIVTILPLTRVDYTFTNVTSDHTISASFYGPVLSYLTISLTGTGSGTVNSTTAGATFACDSMSCQRYYNRGAMVNLAASPSSGSVFAGWSGACSNATGDCSVVMDGHRSVTATFNRLPPPFRISSGTENSFDSFFDAYMAVQEETPATIQVRGSEVTEEINLNRDVAVLLKGGFDADFAAIDGFMTLQGKLVISRGSLRVERLMIR